MVRIYTGIKIDADNCFLCGIWIKWGKGGLFFISRSQYVYMHIDIVKCKPQRAVLAKGCIRCKSKINRASTLTCKTCYNTPVDNPEAFVFTA